MKQAFSGYLCYLCQTKRSWQVGTETSIDTNTDTIGDTGEETTTETATEPQSATFVERDSSSGYDSCPDGQVIVGFEVFLRDFDLVHGRFRAFFSISSISLIDNRCIVKIAPGDTLPMRTVAGEIPWQERVLKTRWSWD